MTNRTDLLRNKGRIYVFDERAAVKDWVELTLVDTVNWSSPTNPIEVKSPSGITVYESIDPDAQISFDWYHPGNYSAIELLFRGALELDSYDGETAQEETVVVRFGALGDAASLPGFDGDKTVVTVSAVVLDATPATTYTVTTDYTLAVDATTGMSHLVQVSGGSIPLNTDIRVTYTYTPLASNVLRPIENGQLDPRFVIIDTPTDPNDATKYRRYYLPRATITSDLMHSHLEFGKENANPNIMPVTLKYQKPDTATNQSKWYWIDTVHDVPVAA